MATLVDFDSPVYALAAACDNATWNYRGRSWESKAVAVRALEAEGKDASELERVVNPEPWEKVRYTVNKYTDEFLDLLKDSFDTTLLVSGGRGNFRYDVATIFPYKGNRLQELPYHFKAIKEYIINEYEAKQVYHVEVDDAMGILYEEGDTLVHIDKDLNQFPGKHINPTTKREYTVTPLDGMRQIYFQLLTGDSTDNIGGIYGVGSSSAYIKQIKAMDNEEEMFTLAKDLYYSRFGSYYNQFMLENMRLVYLIQKFIPIVIKESDSLNFYTQDWKEKIFIET